MIFVTIGTQQPFTRLLKIMDELTDALALPEVTVQGCGADYVPKHMRALPDLPTADFERYVAAADLVVCHAGMGSILTALLLRKPVIIFPRRLDLGEVRSDHQTATAKRLGELGYVHVADDKEALRARIAGFLAGQVQPLQSITPFASGEMLDAVAAFIREK